VPRVRAKRHPNANLVGSLTHCERQHAVETDERQRQGRRTKNRGHESQASGAAETVRSKAHLISEREDVVDGNGIILLSERALDLSRGSLWRDAAGHANMEHARALEELIDELNAVVGPLENFILPGGSAGAAALQVARAVCRRAERRVVTLAGKESVRPEALAYLNRLSDLLFVMARYENKQRGIKEPLWDTKA